MTALDFSKDPHKRFNPLTREWVLVSPQRTQRPWQGLVDSTPVLGVTEYDPSCYMCPGNRRSTGAINPDYRGVFVFDNDFPALVPDTSSAEMNERGLLVAKTQAGICRVLCFSPKHHLTLATLEPEGIRSVVDAWADQCRELGSRGDIQYVQVFENRGVMMGASNPHPHCQIWATADIPQIVRTEQESQHAYQDEHRSCLLCDYLALETEIKDRVVETNAHFMAIVPFWATWPFELIVIAKRHLGDLTELNGAERDGLGEMLKNLTARCDRLFETSFPYSMGFHQRPADGEEHGEWHLHAHFFPPLLRSATIRKFMVGYEMLAMPQRDITPEEAARRLRGEDIHKSK